MLPWSALAVLTLQYSVYLNGTLGNLAEKFEVKGSGTPATRLARQRPKYLNG